MRFITENQAFEENYIFQNSLTLAKLCPLARITQASPSKKIDFGRDELLTQKKIHLTQKINSISPKYFFHLTQNLKLPHPRFSFHLTQKLHLTSPKNYI